MDVPELIPIEEYDAKQARLEASISWVLTRAFGTNIPPGLKEPFYTDKQDRVCLRPVVINGLVSSDIYCRACRHIFRETTMNWKGHMSVMQALSRKGIYVMDPKQSAVTESMLMQNSPFQLDSHLSLIDALMTAYTVETVTVERVVQAVRRFTSFNASSELPYDTEDAILFWLNKVCGIVRNRLSTGGKEDSTSRSRSKSVADSSHIPVMDDLLKDLNDGCCLATLISFYCPIALRLHDIAMSEGLGIADSMFNIQLVLEFCDNHLPLKTLHLTMNDLFYTSDSIKPHLLAFLAELFFWFEVKKADCVQDVAKMINGGGGVQGTDNGDVSPSKKAHTPTRGTPTVPISTATKKSFHGESLRNTDSTSTPDLFNNSNQSMPRARQPLLPKRLQEKKNSAHEIYKFNERIRRSRSFTSVHDKELKIADSFQAWGENGEDTAPPHGNPRRGHTSPVRAHGRNSQQSSLTNVTNSNLLSNVSIDTEGSLDISTDTSMTISGLEETPRTTTGRTNRSRNMVNEGDLDLQSFSSATTSRSGSKDLVTHGDNPGHKNPGGNPGHKNMDSQEPLMPAQVRPSKEKINNGHSKGFESGESQQLRKSPVSPTKSSKLTTFRDINNPVSIDDESPSDSEYLTPSTENVPFQGFEFPAKASEGEPPLSPSKTKSGLAFFVDTEHSLSTSTPKTGRSTAQSFVINGTEYTAETARAAGIPVVSSNEYRGTSPRRQWDKPGPMFESSLNSSGDGSDQELRKIRADHRDKESPKSPKAAAESFFITANGEMVVRPDSLNIKATGSSSSVKQQSNTRDTPSPKTSFAEISQRKSSGDISSGLNQSESDSQSTLSLKEQFEKARQARTGVKKTTFAALPNQTTWQETAQKNNDPSPYDERAPAGIPKEGSAMGSELIDVRMQLEERRRQIENDKRKTEMQWSKQRQKVGKQAFMQVINKNKDDSSSSSNIVGKKVIPKTIPENKEISPTTSQRPGTNLQNSRTSPNRTSPSRASPSRNKVSRSQSERIPASQRTSSHNILRNKPLASEAEDRLQEIMQRLETIEMPSSSRKASKESHSESSSTSSMKGLMEQDSLTNVHQTNHARSGGSKPQQQQQSKSSSSATSATNKKPFSREDIQNKIDGVKQRWFSGDERSARSGSTPPRQTQAPSRHGTGGSEMMSHSSEEPLEGGVHQKPPTPATTAMSQSLGEQKEYSSSLDKLNTSLSELQGEIMRLSLQQDQIKCMVKDEKRASPTPGGNLSGEKEASKSQGDQFYLYPREGNTGEPDVAGGMRTVPTQPQPQQPQPAAPPVQPATQPTQPQHSAMPGQMPPGQYPGGYGHYHQPHTYGGPVMAGGYVPPPIQHPSVQGYGQSPHYNPSVQSPQHGYILPPGVPPTSVYPNATTTGHWGGTGPHHQPTGGYHHPAVGVPSPIAGHIPPHTTAYHQQPVNYPQSDQQLGGLAGHHSTMGSNAGLYHEPSRQVPVSTATTPGSHHHHTPLSPQQQPVTMPTTTTATTGYPPSTGSGSHHSSHHTTPSHSQVQSPVASQRQSPARQSPSYRNSPSPEKTVHSPPNTTVVTATAGVITSPVGSVHSNASGGGNIRSPLGNNSSVVSPIDPAKLFNDEDENGVQDRNQPAEGEPGQEGFFVVFDEGTPVKPKPQLGNRKKDPDSTKAAGRKISPPGPPYPHYPSHDDQLIPAGMAPMPADVGDVRDSDPPRSESPYGAPPEAFVISHDDEEDGGEQSEIVKRKQKFIVMQNKRREEENKKKRKLEEERQKMKEEQRVKEEQADRKKQEEKSRREQIFQDYLKRKEEREIEQELSRVGMAPVQKRNQQKQKTKAGTRPKSQPPSSLHEGDKYSASSHSSQEDLARTRGRSPADRARKGLSVHESPKHGPSREMLFSPDHPDSNNLAYGGLTHRRPPTPDKSRLPPGLGDHANNNNTDYSGPKLFKKPSAKSNRQVVNQAVSHCCLAGTVNNDNKNKVLEILNHSEANHFVILFRDHSMQYRGLYTYNPETEEIFKLSGVGPKQVTSKMVEGFYKYNSGAKKFSQVTTTKHMSATIDAITIHTSHWVKKKVDKKPPTGHY